MAMAMAMVMFGAHTHRDTRRERDKNNGKSQKCQRRREIKAECEGGITIGNGNRRAFFGCLCSVSTRLFVVYLFRCGALSVTPARFLSVCLCVRVLSVFLYFFFNVCPRLFGSARSVFVFGQQQMGGTTHKKKDKITKIKSMEEERKMGEQRYTRRSQSFFMFLSFFSGTRPNSLQSPAQPKLNQSKKKG